MIGNNTHNQNIKDQVSEALPILAQDETFYQKLEVLAHHDETIHSMAANFLQSGEIKPEQINPNTIDPHNIDPAKFDTRVEVHPPRLFLTPKGGNQAEIVIEVDENHPLIKEEEQKQNMAGEVLQVLSGVVSGTVEAAVINAAAKEIVAEHEASAAKEKKGIVATIKETFSAENIEKFFSDFGSKMMALFSGKVAMPWMAEQDPAETLPTPVIEGQEIVKDKGRTGRV